jgi:hypothetical protein
MKKEKLSLKSIKNVLSREELKKIMAGSGPCVYPSQTCGGNSGISCCSPYTCVGGYGGSTGVCQYVY